MRIDGNDVLASYAASRMYLEEARSGSGPRAIEAVTYRMGAHTTSDDPTKYRTRDEEAMWAGRDPISRMRAFLENRGASEAFFADVDAEGEAVAADARDRVVALPNPEPSSMFSNVYSDPHALMEQQSAWLAEYEASFEGDAA
jgi:pyruvate dehydrogenase E1 component alpha subunit